MKTLIRLLFRLIALPFVSVIIVIAGIRNILYNIGLFIFFGGEMMTFKAKNESKTVNDCYELLKTKLL